MFILLGHLTYLLEMNLDNICWICYMDSMESRDFCDWLATVSDSEVLRNLKFSYCNTEEFNSLLNNITGSGNIELSVFHLNIHSVNKNSAELYMYNFLQLINLDFDVIILSEIWAYNIDLYQNLFPNYVFCYDLPLVSNVGGHIATL